MLHQLLTSSTVNHPDQIALVDKTRTLTYRELDALSTQLAQYLEGYGITQGDRVGLYLDKSLEAVAAICAILKVGAAYVPLDPASPVKRIAFLIENCQMKGLITNQAKMKGLVTELPTLPPCLVCIDQTSSVGVAAIPPNLDLSANVRCGNRTDDNNQSGTGEALAYILYTSGSTGQPKGVMISQRAALSFVNWAVGYVGLQAGDRVASHAPFHFDLSIFDLFATFKAGATLVLVPPELSIFPRNLADWIARMGITVWYSVPSVLTRLVLHGGLERYSFAHLRQILFAGEVFPITHLRQLQRLLPHAHYHNLYGPTETNVCTVYGVATIPADQRSPVAIGRACAGCELFVLNDQGEPCQVGEVGTLHVGGASLMQGYWGLPAQTDAVLRPHPQAPGVKLYCTGDLVYQTDDGNYHFCGRRDAQVKSRGYRIELGEVEVILHTHPAVAEAVVVARPDAEVGALLKAIVVVRGGHSFTASDLTRFCAERLPSYMLPSTIEFRPQLPVMATGKIDRLLLQKEVIA